MTKNKLIELNNSRKDLEDFVFSAFINYRDNSCILMGDEVVKEFELDDEYIYITWVADYKYGDGPTGLEKIKIEDFVEYGKDLVS